MTQFDHAQLRIGGLTYRGSVYTPTGAAPVHPTVVLHHGPTREDVARERRVEEFPVAFAVTGSVECDGLDSPLGERS